MPLYKAQTESSGIIIPTDIRTTANDSDYILAVNSTTQQLYKITKADLLAGLSSSGGSSGGGTSYFADVVLLLPFNTNTVDIKGNIITTSGAPTIDTSIFKYGGGSLHLDGSSYVSVANASPLALGSSDFTIECWVYPEFSGSVKDIATHRTNYATDQAWSINTYSPSGLGNLGFYANNSNAISLTTSYAPTQNVWTHIAVVRSGNTFTMYANGNSIGSTSSSSAIQSTSADIHIGNAPDQGSENWAGNIDDFGITKFAKYTANFTPPTQLPTS
ncbi:hypothetical protein GTQ43_20795 [Nostoc sp. KVJ3]|uniref:LamG domain-containing protein n=1 Tax=Nostoc sp. KVJ3 TaxID=457945 RepID=UPI002238DDC0|nr:LamG domain-containing protein [Nostoc sp. KVJ3]MCW5316163.1 hypothetical protein [Nostoc sp. KVJ3]